MASISESLRSLAQSLISWDATCVMSDMTEQVRVVLANRCLQMLVNGRPLTRLRQKSASHEPRKGSYHKDGGAAIGVLGTLEPTVPERLTCTELFRLVVGVPLACRWPFIAATSAAASLTDCATRFIVDLTHDAISPVTCQLGRKQTKRHEMKIHARGVSWKDMHNILALLPTTKLDRTLQAVRKATRKGQRKRAEHEHTRCLVLPDKSNRIAG